MTTKDEMAEAMWETTGNSLAETATKRQQDAALLLLESLSAGILSRDQALEQLCMALAQEFREGINLTIQFYGLDKLS